MKNSIDYNKKVEIIENVLTKYIHQRINYLIEKNIIASKNDYLTFLENPIKSKFANIYIWFHIDVANVFNKTFRKLILSRIKIDNKVKQQYLNLRKICSNFKNIEYVGKVSKRFKSNKKFNRNSYFRFKKAIAEELINKNDIELTKDAKPFYDRLMKCSRIYDIIGNVQRTTKRKKKSNEREETETKKVL